MPQVTDQVAANPLLNPLAKHFRQPALYINLTSQGRYWDDNCLELPVTGKIPVFPMTTRDEITLRTPDALIDGTSVVEVIKSCCPNIKNPWGMPSVDIDSTLIAIRIATYGPAMSVGSKCPACGEEHEYDVDLSGVRDHIEMPDYSTPLVIDDNITINLKPMTYQQVSRSGVKAFEEQRLIQALADAEMSVDDKRAQYNEHRTRMVNLNVENVTASTQSIVINGAETVTNPAFIKEYYTNAESSVIRKVQDRIKEYVDTVGLKPVGVKCTNCGHEFNLNVDFDYSSFFAQGF